MQLAIILHNEGYSVLFRKSGLVFFLRSDLRSAPGPFSAEGGKGGGGME